VILPGTRATVSDLEWLRRSGLGSAVAQRAASGRPVLGICGGYQMLGRTIIDDVESRRGRTDGLGLLPTDVVFGHDKVLARPTGTALGETVQGYEIHHGTVTVSGGAPFLDGCSSGSVRGTTWHGIFDADGFRRAFLRELAAQTGREFVGADDVVFADVRTRRLDALADLVADHLDTAAITYLIENGAPKGLSVLRTSLS
jgi:adenosylcobyric acid synthase